MRALAFLLILLALFVPRAYLVAEFSPALIESDEAIVGLMAMHILQEGQTPIFYYGQHYMGSLAAYVTALIMSVTGVLPIALKIAPSLFFAGFLVAHYLLARRLLQGKADAYLATLPLALAPPFLMIWSLKSRGGYMLLLLLGTSALLLTVQWLQDNSSQKRLLFIGACLGLAFWTHFAAISYVAAVSAVILLYRRTQAYRASLLIGAGFFVGTLPVIVYNILHLGASLSRPFYRQTTLLEDLQHLFQVGLPILLGGQAIRQIEGYFWLSGLLLLLVWTASFSKIAFGETLFRRPEWGLIGLLLLGHLILTIASGACYFLGEPRYLIPLYSGLYIVLVRGLPRPSIRFAVVIGLLVLHLYGFSRIDPKAFLTPENAEDHTKIIEWLDEAGVEYSFAPYWIAYRLTFETREDHVSSPPPDDYIRYEDYYLAVQRAHRKAYIRLTQETYGKESWIEVPETYRPIRIGSFELFLPAGDPALEKTPDSSDR